MKHNNCRNQKNSKKSGNNSGAVAVIIAILMTVLAGVAALAIDIGHVAVVRNELQNAADAGALAGARVLYNYDGSGTESVNTGANAVARNAALANYSDKRAVEVPSVLRGHWDMGAHTFTASSSTDTSYINAVRVTTQRSSAESYFAGIFGIQSFSGSASAVAYRGYAGQEVEYDEPIAICRDMIEDADGNYQCTKGKMIHSGNSNPQTVETGRWTNFSEGCETSANKPNVTELICSDLEPMSLASISTINGEVEPAMNALHTCWESTTNKTQPWGLTLPVVECVQPVTCSQIVGAVRVKVMWVTDNGNDPQYNEIPQQMEDWSSDVNCAEYDLSAKEGREQCWTNFVNHFQLVYIDEEGNEQPAVYQPVTLYFLPDCEYESEGGPGGEAFNIHARYPKLVK